MCVRKKEVPIQNCYFGDFADASDSALSLSPQKLQSTFFNLANARVFLWNTSGSRWTIAKR
jgi:hypothetical protein